MENAHVTFLRALFTHSKLKYLFDYSNSWAIIDPPAHQVGFVLHDSHPEVDIHFWLRLCSRQESNSNTQWNVVFYVNYAYYL